MRHGRLGRAVTAVVHPCRWVVGDIGVEVEALGAGRIRLDAVSAQEAAQAGVQVTRPQVEQVRLRCKEFTRKAKGAALAALGVHAAKDGVVCRTHQRPAVVGHATHRTERIGQQGLARDWHVSWRGA